MTQLKLLILTLANSEIARAAYAAIAGKWGAVGIAIALALSILVGALAFGFTPEAIEAWFKALSVPGGVLVLWVIGAVLIALGG